MVIVNTSAFTSGAAAPAPGHAATWVGGQIGALGQPVLAAVKAMVLQPLTLGPDVTAAWAVTRDIAGGLLLAVLLYGVLRSQLATLFGLEAATPWLLLPRLALAAAGIGLSLPLVRGLLAANNALCAALVGALPANGWQILSPNATLSTGLSVGAASLLGIDVVAGLLLVGAAALACFYIVRAAEIVLLALLLPLALALWVVPAAASVWRAIFGELLVSIFVQSIQVVVLIAFADGTGSLTPGTTGPDWMWGIAALALLFKSRGLLAAAVAATVRWVPGPESLPAGARTAAAMASRIMARGPGVRLGAGG